MIVSWIYIQHHISKSLSVSTNHLSGNLSMTICFSDLFIGYSFSDYLLFLRCGHCKKLAPEYEKLGASFKKAKSVLIAKVHLTLFSLPRGMLVLQQFSSFTSHNFLWYRNLF
jgi:thiol-disulfide isomerase/thioredoxin